MRWWLAALVVFGLSQAASAQSRRTFVPTSDAIRMAEIIARAQGYDLDDRRRYFFDLVRDREGKPLIAGFTTFEFQWNGSLVSTIAIDDHSGLAVDTTSCTIYAYPALRPFQSAVARSAPDALRDKTGCDRFRVADTPRTHRQPRR
ncbi:hypothetical protein [Sphingomonas sp.]|uniref:hypothetical protein n=1 Tax=Sphingomonas sp. TaxID=28214 RepID=UPI003B004805